MIEQAFGKKAAKKGPVMPQGNMVDLKRKVWVPCLGKI
jgi:hypothetical protein